jgi:hypothetical protein
MELEPLEAVVTGPTFVVHGRVSDDEGVSRAEWSLDRGQTWTPTELDEGPFSLELPTPHVDAQVVTLELRVYDRGLQPAAAALSVTVDTVGPQLTLETPVTGATVTGPLLEVGGQVSDASGPPTRVLLDVGQGPVTAVVNGARFTGRLPLPAGVSGSLTLQAQAVDQAGNVSVVTTSLQLDTRGPPVTLTAPDAGALVGGPGAALLEVVVEGSDVAHPPQAVSVAFGGAPVLASRQGARFAASVPVPTLDFAPAMLRVEATDLSGNVSVVERSLLVDVVPPHLTLEAPLEGAVFNAAALATSSAVPVTFHLADGDPAVALEATGAALQGPGVASVTTSESDDGRPYAVTLVATDSAGNRATQWLHFTVDRRAPTVELTPAAGARRSAATVFEAHFSEPVTSGSVTLSSPAGALVGSLSADGRAWRSGPLARAQVYTAALQGFVDAAGNPAAPQALRFHTGGAYAYAADERALEGDVVAVASDPEGQAMVLTRWADGTLHLSQFNLATGRFGSLVLPSTVEADLAAATDGRLTASSTVKADLTARHVFGLSTSNLGAAVLDAFDDGQLQRSVSSDFSLLVPVPPLAPQDGTAPTGLVEGAQNLRGGRAAEHFAGPRDHLETGRGRLAAWAAQPGALAVSDYVCSDTAAFRQCGTAERSITLDAPSEASVTVAPGGDCLAVAGLVGGAPRLFTRAAWTCQATCAAPSLQVGVGLPGLVLAPSSTSGREGVLGAWLSGPTLSLGVMTACSGAFSLVATHALAGVPSELHPVQLGERDAVLYSQNHAVYVWAP